MKLVDKVIKILIFIMTFCFIYYFTIRDSGGYPYVQSLVDYEHGFVRRGLWGALGNVFGSYPFSYEKYMMAMDFLYVGLGGLVIILFATVEYRRNQNNNGLFIYLMLILTSPFFIKNFVSDKGRLDVIGAALITLLALISLLNFPRLIIIFASLFTVVISLFGDNIFVLYGIPMLLISYVSAQERSVAKAWALLPAVAFIVSFSINFFAHPPVTSMGEFNNYLQSKTLDKITFESIAPLYKTGSDFIQFNYDPSNRITDNLTKDGFLGFWLLLILNLGVILAVLKDSIALRNFDQGEKLLLVLSFTFGAILLVETTDWIRFLSNFIFWISILCVRYSGRWNVNYSNFNSASVYKVLIVFQLLFPASMGIGVWYPWSAHIEFRMDPGVRPEYDISDLINFIR